MSAKMANNDPRKEKLKALRDHLYNAAYLIGELRIQDLQVFPQDTALITMVSTVLDELDSEFGEELDGA